MNDIIDVSILILLDTLLLLLFSPRIALILLVLFQSLFYWIHYFYNYTRVSSSKQYTRFNPYFTGYTTFTKTNILKGNKNGCFNPYFTGYTTFTSSISWFDQLLFGFQSLFYWIHYFYLVQNF